MPSQGITVSILAKIEGWLDLIKLIQNAMKNIKPGTDISKGLVKDLQLVNEMVNNLGKNMNQRLTSDSLITGFVDKIMLVEEVFGRLGTSMSHISFGDINPEYITAGFKDLLSTLELANNALGQGMESSFQNAIANSKNLLKEFARMKIDPKSMNINAIQEALAERGKALEKDVNEGLKKLTDFEKGLEKLKNTRDELAARDAFLGKDANATVQSLLVGHQLPTKGTILDADELEKQVSFFRSNLLKAGFTPTQLNHIIPDLETVMKAGHWDEMPSKFAEYLREAQNRTKNSLEKASQEYRDAIVLHQRMSGTLSHLSSLRFNNTLAQNEVSNILSGTVQNDTKSLRDIVHNLKQLLETAVTSGFKGLGGQLFSSSQLGMLNASAAMKDYSTALDLVKAKELAVNKVQGVVLRYFSIYAAVRMAGKAIRSMMNNIKDLDKTITDIAIVTKMNQDDLWGLMPEYTQMALKYAASISGVYKVSQLYYQQGLGQSDVMALTEQTLKMARISGLDYAEATDYMTNAVRSFKMEMTDAGTVVDVYSAVAASSASSVTELATAMSKTASSAAAVGSSFENTTAMLAVMIEATRESPENIGSAMKSIISRYGELKENKTGIDEEGEEYSLNKVDTALLSVGISIHDANGEFRDFDDVIMELSSKWNTIDKNTLRYIATVMAGNRLQSRFLALVSSYDRLIEESEKAANSEDASQLLFLKTMDSIEAKTQLLSTSMQSLYTSSGFEKLYKDALDFGNAIALSLSNLSEKLGLGAAIGKIGADFTNMATLATTAFSMIKNLMLKTKGTLLLDSLLGVLQLNITNRKDTIAALRGKTYAPVKDALGNILLNTKSDEQSLDEKTISNLEALNTKDEELVTQLLNNLIALQKQANKMAKILGAGLALSAAGTALGAWANTVDINENRNLKAGLTTGSSLLSGAGTGLMVGATAGPVIGTIVGILSALPGVLLGLGMFTESTAERLQKLLTNLDNAKNDKIKSKDELKTLEDYKKKYDELSKSLYESAEKKKEFMELSNSIAANYPELIKSMDAEGNYLVNMTAGYEKLAKAKREAYKANLVTEMGASINSLEDVDYVLQNVYGLKLLKNKRDALGWMGTDVEKLVKIDYNKDNWSQETSNLLGSAWGQYTLHSLYTDEIQENETYKKMFTDARTSTFQGKMYNAITSNGVDILTGLTNDILSGIEEGKDLATVQSELINGNEWGPLYEDLINNFDSSVYTEIKNRYDIPKYQKELVANRMDAYSTEYINLIADSSDTLFKTESSDLAKRFAKTSLADEWSDTYDELMAKLKAGKKVDWLEEITNFYRSKEEMWYRDITSSEELTGMTDAAEEFYSNLGKHTKEDIEKLFQDKQLDNLTGEEREAAKAFNKLLEKRRDFFKKIYKEDYGDALKRYGEWLEQDDVQKFKINNYSQTIGAEYIPLILESYKQIISNESLSDALKQTLIENLNSIYDITSGLAFDQRSAVLEKLISGDLTSITGIYNLIDDLSSIEDFDLTTGAGALLKLKLQLFSKDLRLNISTEIDNYFDTLEKTSEGFDSALSSATGGMNIKLAQEMADKLGVSLSEFEIHGGKFYYNNLEKLKEAYLKDGTEAMTQLLSSINDAYGQLAEGKTIGESNIKASDILTGDVALKDLKDLSEDDLKWFEEAYNIDYSNLLIYYKDFLDLINDPEGFKELMPYLLDRVTKDSAQIEKWVNQLTALSLIKSGDVEGFMKTTGMWKTEDTQEYLDLINKTNEAMAAAEAINTDAMLIINDHYQEYLNEAITNVLGVSNSEIDARTQALQAVLELNLLAVQRLIQENNLPVELFNTAYDEAIKQAEAALNDLDLINNTWQEYTGLASDELRGGIRIADINSKALELDEAYDNLLLAQIDKNNDWATIESVESDFIEGKRIAIEKVQELADTLEDKDFEQDLLDAGYNFGFDNGELLVEDFEDWGRLALEADIQKVIQSKKDEGTYTETWELLYRAAMETQLNLDGYTEEEYRKAFEKNEAIYDSVLYRNKDYFAEAWLQLLDEGYTSYYTWDDLAAAALERAELAAESNALLLKKMTDSTWENFIDDAKAELGVKEFTNELLEATARRIAMEKAGITSIGSTDWKDYMPEKFANMTDEEIISWGAELAKNAEENNALLIASVENLTYELLRELAKQLLGAKEYTEAELEAEARKIAQEEYGIDLQSVNAEDYIPKELLDMGQEGRELWAKLLNMTSEEREAALNELTELNKIANKTLMDLIVHGDTSGLDDKTKQYAKAIYDTFNGLQKSISNDMIKAVGKEGADFTWVTAENLKVILALLQEGWIQQGATELGDKVYYDLTKIQANSTKFLTQAMSLYNNNKEKILVLTDYYNALYTDKTEAFSKMLTEDSVALSDFATYMVENKGKTPELLANASTLTLLASDYGLKLTDAGKLVIDNYAKYIQSLTDDLNILIANGATTQEINEQKAKIDNIRNRETKNRSESINNLIKNYDNVSAEQREAFANSLGKDYDDVSQYFEDNGLGGYKLNIGLLQLDIKNKVIDVDEAIQNSLFKEFETNTDTFLKNMTSATDLVSKGTTSRADIQEFKNQAAALGMKISDSAFKYDDILKAWTLDPATLRSFVLALGLQLIDLGLLSFDEVTKYVNDNVTKTLVSAIDIKGFLEAEDKSGLARKKFAKLLSDAGIDSRGINGIINTLIEGGGAAVSLMLSIALLKGEELTSADIELAYRALVSEIENSLDLITFGPGGIVSGYAVTILDTLAKEGKAEIVHLDANNAVIKSITDIGAAYAEYYDALAKSGEATLEALNEAKAKVLETLDGRHKEQSAIDALGEAAGMTYTAFAAILSDAGIEMTDDIIRDYTESLGGNKMRIKDFSAFARAMKWDFNSEEYTSGLKAYNDGLIERNTLVKDQITEELLGLKEFKSGDWLNLTYTEKLLKKYSKSDKAYIRKALGSTSGYIEALLLAEKLALADTFFNDLLNSLAAVGAYFDDGILKTVEGANLIGIIDILTTKISEAATDIDIDTTALQDLLAEVIKAYTDAIVNGIKGTLSHGDKSNLQSQARDFGVELTDTDFYETSDGLKLSYEAAAKLYTNVSRVNAIKGKLVFDELNSSLQESDSRFKDLTSIMTQILQLANEINELLALGDGGAADERVAAAERELALAKEIAMVRLTTKDDPSFKILGKDTLAISTQNAANYSQDIGTVVLKAEEWATNGYMSYSDVADFSDFVTHMIDLGDLSGKGVNVFGAQMGGKGGYTKSEFLAAISKALHFWTDDKGNVQFGLDNELFNLALKELVPGSSGMNISTGKAGLKEATDAAGEELKTYGKELRGYDDIFSDMDYLSKSRRDSIKEFTDVEDLIDENGFLNMENRSEKFKKSLMDSAEHIKVGDETLADGIKKGKLLLPEYLKALSDLITLAETTDWQLESGYETIKEHMLRYGIEEEVDFGDFTYLMKNDHLLARDNKTGKYVTDDGKEFTSAELALVHMNQEDLAELSTTFNKYNAKAEETSEYEIQLNDITYKAKVNAQGEIELSASGGTLNGKTYRSTEAMMKAGYQEYIQLWNKEHPIEEGLTWAELYGDSTYISEAAWRLGLRAENATPAAYIKGGGISELSRAAFLKEGFQTWQQVQEEWNSMVETYGAKGALLEWEAKYHTRFVPDNDTGEMSLLFAESYLKAMNLTLAAADVASGIDAALLSESVQTALGTAMASGLKESLKSEGTIEVEAPEIIIKPNKITIESKGILAEIKGELQTEEAEANIPERPSGMPSDAYEHYKEYVASLLPAISQTAELATPTETMAIQRVQVVYEPGDLPEAPLEQVTAEINYELGETPEGVTAEDGTANINYSEGDKPQNVTAPDGSGKINYTVGSVDIPSPVGTGTINYKVGSVEKPAEATGNFSYAYGNAFAGGTLMGELGPELVVSKGRYFIVGQSGPEMVNLADDAIVFNHLQTQSLLTKGMSSTRGRAITNELNAVAFATGSRNGGVALLGGQYVDTSTMGASYTSPFMGLYDTGVLSAYNAVLKTEEAVANTAEEAKNFIDKLERWFNWLQKIAHLEKEISIEEAKRTRYTSDMIPHGKEYFTSQIASLDALNELLAVQLDLNRARKEYFETLRAELNQGAFSILYEFDENFLPKYKEGMYEFMSNLLEADWYKTGAPNNEAKTIYNKLVSMGFGSMMEYDSSGNKINKDKDGWENQAVQAFVERYKKGLEEGQKYHDDIMDGELKVEELIDAENQILKEIEDNLISVENKVLKAIEDMRQLEIDNLSDEKDAIEKSANRLIDGLNNLLDRERDMYQNQQSIDELLALLRKLDILLRSGGSAVEIADLLSLIQEKLYDNYFNQLELQIQAILDASDAEIERLDNLIALMEETLAYEKENGLLWALVNEILTTQNPELIALFISDNTKEYWGKSPTELVLKVREDLFEIERFKEFLTIYDGMQVLIDMYGEEAALKRAEKKKKEEEEAAAAQKKALTLQPLKPLLIRSGGGGYTGNGSNLNKAATKKQYVVSYGGLDHVFDTKEKAETYQMNATGGVLSYAAQLKSDAIRNGISEEEAQKMADEYINLNEHKIGEVKETTVVVDNKGVVIPNYDLNGKQTKEVNKGDNFIKNGKIYSMNNDGSWKFLGMAPKIEETKKKASGGYVNHGIYELGERGTETVFTAEQTLVLRNNILSNRPNSLISLLKTYNSSYDGIIKAFTSRIDSKGNIENGSNIITIERAEVNLNIDKLADDYDSKRAANTVMEEMLRIAAKTKANNSVRR